jgi:hypothetical protein
VGPYIITKVISGGAYRLQDKKQEKMRATRGMQSNYGVSMRRRNMATS